jgi:hypothetical protein
VLGVLTLQRHQDLQGRCPNGVCAPDQQGDLDAAKQLGNFSTIAFGIGAAGLALGTVLIFTAGSSEVDHAETASKHRFAGLSDPHIAVGPMHIELGANF